MSSSSTGKALRGLAGKWPQHVSCECHAQLAGRWPDHSQPHLRLHRRGQHPTFDSGPTCAAVRILGALLPSPGTLGMGRHQDSRWMSPRRRPARSAAGWMRRGTLAAGKGHLIWRGRLQPRCSSDPCDRPTSQLSSWRQIEAGVDSAADLSRSRVCSIPARLYAASCSTPLTGLPSTFATGPRWSIQVSVTRHPVAVVWNS